MIDSTVAFNMVETTPAQVPFITTSGTILTAIQYHSNAT